MQREQLCHKRGEMEVQKRPISASTFHSHSDSRQVITPNETQARVISTNLLPSKLEKVPGRPLPPLQGATVLAVQKNDSRTSFKPAKSSDYGSRSTLPVKGQHVFDVPRTLPCVIRVPTAVQHEAQCTESERTSSVDECVSAENKRNNKMPTRLQRSHSVSRLSRLSSVSSDTKPRKLPNSSSVPSDTRPSRPATPQRAAIDKNANNVANGQVGSETVSAKNNSGSVVPRISRRRSSSVTSAARVPLQRLNPPRTSSPLTSGKVIVATDSKDSALTGGKQSFSKENRLKTSDRNENAKSQLDTEQLASDSHHLQTAEQRVSVYSRTLPQETADGRLKLLEKTSSNRGILGGTSPGDVIVTARTGDDIEQKSPPSTHRHSSMVSVNYFLAIVVINVLMFFKRFCYFSIKQTYICVFIIKIVSRFTF